MFTGIINDCGLSYSAETPKEIGIKLNEYIIEMYGPHSVLNVQKETTYSGCNLINSPGEYLIIPKKDPNNQIYCKIS